MFGIQRASKSAVAVSAFLAASALTGISNANAVPYTVGAANSNNAQPFGSPPAAPGGYEQEFAANAFASLPAGSTVITSLSFGIAGSGTLSPDTFAIYLSTPTGPLTTNYVGNIGANEALVATTTLPTGTLNNGSSFTISINAFNYTPGNALLLRVEDTSSTVHAGTAFLNADALDHDLSRLTIDGGTASLNNSFGLVTTFDFSAPPASVPEPRSLALLGVSLLGLALGRQRFNFGRFTQG